DSASIQSMATKSKFQAIRGTRDLLPPETALWNRVEEIAREVFATFGFGEIRPPILEQTELFARSIGVETDVVSKEMFTFALRADESEHRRVKPETVAMTEEVLRSDPNRFANGYLKDPAERLDFEARMRDDAVSLRPEATASVCRAYIEHNM